MFFQNSAIMNKSDFPKYVTQFISKYLPFELGLSTNTIKAYRDTLVLLIKFFKIIKNLREDRIQIPTISKEIVLEFLDWIQTNRSCSDSTRNSRLAAIKTFFRYVKDQDIIFLFQFQQIQSIRAKKTMSKTMSYLTIEGLKLLFQQPDLSSRKGRRDLALLSLMYDSGARVQEIIDLTPSMLRLEKPSTVQLLGKGNKMRLVPLLNDQILILKEYLNEHNLDQAHRNKHPVFYNSKKEKLSRAGINYIISKYANKAKSKNNSLIPEKLSCHSMRHSKAMHLFQSGVNIVYIKDILGHSSVTTTERYVRADSKFKREALEKAYLKLTPSETAIWEKNDSLINWLNKF